MISSFVRITFGMTSYRNDVYRCNQGDYQFLNMRVRFGDKLIFERSDASSRDNLLALDDDSYNSEILLVSERDVYSEDEISEYISFTSYNWYCQMVIS